MFYRTIDYLACPADKTPLIADKIMDWSERAEPVCRSRCRFYCAFKGTEISDGISHEDCERCHKAEIITAFLKCPECGASFPVENGIARLMPKEEDILPEMRGSFSVKNDEMRARDEVAAEFDYGYSLGRDLLEINSFMKRLSLSEDDQVLELGCGTGRLTMAMAPLCREIICIDFSFESLKELSRKHRLRSSGTVHLLHADINFMPLRKEYLFEKIASSGTIQHIPADFKLGALKEIDSHLASSGIFVVSAYNFSGMTEETRQKEGYHSGKIYFYRYGSDEFRDFLSRIFSVSEMAGMINLPTHKVVGTLMKIGLPNLALNIEFFIQGTRLSFRCGEMLIAVCRKRTD